MSFKADVLDEIKKSCIRLAELNKQNVNNKMLTFGVNYLDECLLGIRPTDFVMVGARTGTGKTHLAKEIAVKNSTGFRVHFFALEAEHGEIERRMAYTVLADAVYGPMLREKLTSEFRKIGSQLNYAEWVIGRFDSILTVYEKEILERVAETCPGLHTYYQGDSVLNETNIERTILGIQDQTDLIIIDHLHYFDFEDQNENRAMKKLLRALKLVTEAKVNPKPVVMVSHLRKRDKRFPSIVPDLDDFHGSSDISKFATKAVMFAKAEGNGPDIYTYPTYVYAPKFRDDMSRTNYVALCNFDVRRNSYGHNYYLGQKSFDDKEWKPVDQKPYWAKSASPTLPSPIPPPQEKPRSSIRRPRVDIDN